MFTFVLIMSIVIALGCLAVPVSIAIRGLIDRPRVQVLVHHRMREIASAFHTDPAETERW